MYFNSSAFGNYEVELLRAGEVADAGVGDVGGLVRRDHIVPHAHLGLALPGFPACGGDPVLPSVATEGNCRLLNARRRRRRGSRRRGRGRGALYFK